jgi:hypothetical protein
MASLASASKCLYCIWPALIIGIGWWLARMVDGKTYYGALPVGVDPLSPQGQGEFEVTRLRDADKRRIIFWCAGIVIGGYLLYFLINHFTVQARASSLPPAPTAAATETGTLLPSETFTPAPPVTGTPTGTPSYAPTATDRLVYHQITVVVRQTVIITDVYVVEVTRIVTPTFTPTPLPTATETTTPAPDASETPED